MISWLKHLGMALALAASVPVMAQKVTIRYPADYLDNFSAAIASREFAKRVSELSDGRITVRFAPGGTMYKSAELVPALLRGDAELTSAVGGYWGSVEPRVQLFDLPYAFPSYAAFDRVASNKALISKVFAGVEAKGGKVLGLMVNEYVVPGSKSKPIDELADLKGLKVRGISKISSMTMKALGANAISVATAEVPTALQQGLIDAMQTLPDAYVAWKMWDQIKFVTDTHYQLMYYPWIVNAKWFNGLAEGDRKIVQQAVDEAIANNRKRIVEITAKAKATLESNGVKIIALPQGAEKEWAQVSASVWKELEGEIGKDLMEEFRAAIGSM